MTEIVPVKIQKQKSSTKSMKVECLELIREFVVPTDLFPELSSSCQGIEDLQFQDQVQNWLIRILVYLIKFENGS